MSKKNQEQHPKEKPNFRGFAIHCDGKTGNTQLEAVGVAPLEIYGALVYWIKRIEQGKK